MKKFVCPVCGYVHEAAEMPNDFKCPLCKIDGAKFKVAELLGEDLEPNMTASTKKNLMSASPRLKVGAC